MSILKFIEKVSVQTAVYWGSPVNDGYGNMTYSEPIEIKCRWEDTIKVLSDSNGKEFTSSTSILIPQEYQVEEQGMLFLGTLDDLPSSYTVDEYGSEIKKISKVPLYRKINDFVITIYL